VNDQRSASEHFLPGAVASRLVSCENACSELRDGGFYLAWLACRISTIAPNKNGSKDLGHPRIRITVPKKASTASDMYKQMSLAISAEKIQAFNSLSSPVLSSGGTDQVRLGVHHVAYNAARARPGFQSLTQCGMGASVSHLCDRVGCVRPEHLEFVSSHGDNTRRQRCRGLTLVIAQSADVIIGEQPCLHAGSPEVTEESLALCCRRLCIVPLGKNWPELNKLWEL
jgi:hypothetical protein